jgi:cellulose synthase/poly-beta-1,6-N-acetylglucosamine synthase-like glycosyltransferase
VIDSTTWEEAAASHRPWIRQRSRWLKGFLQTWISQTRAPGEMVRKLGLGRAIIAQIILLVPPVMFLLQPVFWATTLNWLATGVFWLEGAAAALFALTVAEQATVAAAALLAMKRRRAWSLAPWILTLPLYWPMGALAALKALVELVFAPSYWDKTTHGVGRIASHARRRALARLGGAEPF